MNNLDLHFNFTHITSKDYVLGESTLIKLTWKMVIDVSLEAQNICTNAYVEDGII